MSAADSVLTTRCELVCDSTAMPAAARARTSSQVITRSRAHRISSSRDIATPHARSTASTMRSGSTPAVDFTMRVRTSIAAVGSPSDTVRGAG